MAKLGSQSTEDDCCRTPAVVEHHQKELGIGQALGRWVDNRSGAVEQSDQLGNQQEEHLPGLDPREQQQLCYALPRPCGRSLPPSCGPSTPFGSP